MTERPSADRTPVRFVYFDLGNVLASFSVQRACQNVAETWSVAADDVHRAVWQTDLQDRWEHGHLSDQQVAEQIRQRLRLDSHTAPDDHLLDRLCDMFSPLMEMVPVVQAVAASGVPMGILSNTCRAHWQLLQRGGYSSLQQPYATQVLSFEVGSMKPAAPIYVAAEQQAAVPPESLLFFDDRADNVAAAQQRRWQAHLFTDAESALDVLRQTGVLP